MRESRRSVRHQGYAPDDRSRNFEYENSEDERYRRYNGASASNNSVNDRRYYENERGTNHHDSKDDFYYYE